MLRYVDTTPVASPRRWLVGGTAFVAALVLLAGWVSAGQQSAPDPGDTTGRVTLSIVGTTDLHGRVFPRDGHGGLALLGGYLRNLRAARAADGGAVLLLDAGDTFQGGVTSDISEGLLVVDAYNALGYDALAVGNHEFEYGAVDTATGPAATDMRGALKAAAARARFPFLAANVIDAATGHPGGVAQRPAGGDRRRSRAPRGHRRGDDLRRADRGRSPPTSEGLDTTALAPTVEREARHLRRRGVDLVLVVAHAGGQCSRFDDPADLTSCDDNSEIFRLARRLPAGLVDGIVAGHSHRALAHEVAGIPIVQAWSWGRAFARLDLTVERGVGVVSARPFPPRAVCAAVAPDGSCATGGAAPSYEAAPVRPDATIVAAMRAGARAGEPLARRAARHHAGGRFHAEPGRRRVAGRQPLRGCHAGHRAGCRPRDRHGGPARRAASRPPRRRPHPRTPLRRVPLRQPHRDAGHDRDAVAAGPGTPTGPRLGGNPQCLRRPRAGGVRRAAPGARRSSGRRARPSPRPRRSSLRPRTSSPRAPPAMPPSCAGSRRWRWRRWFGMPSPPGSAPAAAGSAPPTSPRRLAGKRPTTGPASRGRSSMPGSSRCCSCVSRKAPCQPLFAETDWQTALPPLGEHQSTSLPSAALLAPCPGCALTAPLWTEHLLQGRGWPALLCFNASRESGGRPCCECSCSSRRCWLLAAGTRRVPRRAIRTEM